MNLLGAALTIVMTVGTALGQPKYQIVHTFGAPGDGVGPISSVVFDSSGNMYGTAGTGGQYNKGVVYEFSPDGSGGWSETIVHSFAGQPTDGYDAQGGVIVGQGGVLYGTTEEGGPYGYGTIYDLTPNSSGWTESLLHTFKISDQMSDPHAGVVQNKAGDLFGNSGGVFELIPDGGEWTFTPICTVTGCSYTNYGGLVLVNTGNLYGDTAVGGPYHGGSVYEVGPAKGDSWQEHDLFYFGSYKDDGQIPVSAQLAADTRGNIYGVTGQGGSHQCNEVGCGTIYKLTRGSNGTWTETILYNFKDIVSLGYGPSSNVILDKGGNLYGVMGGGGAACGCGVVYRLSPSQSGEWNYTVLHTFVGTDGILPTGNLTFGPDDNLYGTTVGGGSYGVGVVFEISRQ